MTWRWKVFDAFAVGVLLALSSKLVIIFFVSYLSGRPILIHVDTFGEGPIEAVVFPLWIGMGIVTLVRMIRRANRG